MVPDDFVVRNDKVVTAKGLEKVDFAFEDVRVTLKTRQGERQLLDGSIRGRALPGRMLAIMYVVLRRNHNRSESCIDVSTTGDPVELENLSCSTRWLVDCPTIPNSPALVVATSTGSLSPPNHSSLRPSSSRMSISFLT